MTTSENGSAEQLPTAAAPAADGDATTFVPPPTQAAPDLAWSQENEYPDDPPSWTKAWLIAAAILVPLAVVAAVIAVPRWVSHRDSSTRSNARVNLSPSEAGSPIAQPPPALDGTYHIEEYPAATTYRSNEAPPVPDNSIIHSWWAFRSRCMPGGCAAYGIKLDKDDHQRADASNSTDYLTFATGAWRDATPEIKHRDCGGGKSETISYAWVFEPQPDGTLRGTDTRTITSDGCGYLGNTAIVPLTMTRVGDAPPGIAAPSTLPPAAPALDVPVLPLQSVSSTDEDLIAKLADHGVVPSEFHGQTAKGAPGEIAAAHVVCDWRAKGRSTAEIVTALMSDTQDVSLSSEQANWLARLAIQTYCPQYEGN